MTEEKDVIPLRALNEDKLEAADWLAKFDRGGLTKEKRQAFADWLPEDPKNEQALRGAVAFWYGLNDPLSKLMPASSRAGYRHAPLRLLPAILFRIVSRFRAVAAVGVLMLLVGTGAVFYTSNLPEQTTGYYSTEIGEANIIALGDGSKVHLNTNSIVEQDYSRTERVVRLISGEAIFDVAHDEKRPFIVYAANGVIRAVGTRFAVRVREDSVDVTVTEGRVAVASRSEAQLIKQSTFELNSGSTIVVDEGETTVIRNSVKTGKEKISEIDLAEQLSWTAGQLVFYDEELHSIITEVSRYTEVEITFADDALKNERITGILEIGEVESMLEGIEESLGIKTEWISSNQVCLSAG